MVSLDAAVLGVARQGKAARGMERHGKAGLGSTGLGSARHGLVGRGVERLGEAGMEWQGTAWRAEARPGLAGHGKTRKTIAVKENTV